MANSEYNLTVVDGTALTISLSGPVGPAGATGPAGAGGGSSTISTSTLTTLTGYIYGNGTTIAGATAATSENTANTLVKRDAYGRAVFSSIGINDPDAEGISYISVSDFSYSLGNNIDLNPNDRTLMFLSTSAGATPNYYTFPNASGSVPVYTDTPALGQVLTATDASGAATWETPAVVSGTAPIDVTSGAISLLDTLPSAYAFTNALRPTFSGSGTPTATSLITAADGDTRYGRDFIQIISTAVEAFSTSAYVNGPDLVLPAGTYDFEMLALIESASETAGGQSNFRCSPNTDVTTGIETRFANVAALGTGGTASTSFRKGSNQLNAPDFFGTCSFDAPNNFASVTTRGTTVLVSETTVSFRIKQRSATDAVNATKIAVGSFIKFTKR